MTEIVSSNVSVDSYTIFLKYKDKAKKIKFSASLTLFFVYLNSLDTLSQTINLQ